MRYKLSLLTLFLLGQQSYAIAPEVNPYLKQSDKSLIQNWDKQDLKRKMTIRQSATAIETQLQATTDAINNHRTTIDAFKAKSEIQTRINLIAKKLEQPTTMCSAVMNTQGASAFNTFASDTANFQSQGTISNALNPMNSAVKITKNYRNNLVQFCSLDAQMKGLCNVSAEPQLQDGDMNASLLFGSGESTTRNQDQVQALGPMIENLTGALHTPEEMKGGHLAGMQYENLRRRYATIVGLAAEGLHDAASAHDYNPIEVVSFENVMRAAETGGSHNHSDEDENGTEKGASNEDVSKPIRVYEITSKQPFKSEQRVTSQYNPVRKHPVTGKVTKHNGTDFAAKIGTETISLAKGRVILSAYKEGNGNYLYLYHPDEQVLTKYLHLDKRLVKTGQMIEAGQVVALTGNTGRSTGPHLHFEVHKTADPNKINPVDWRSANFPSKIN